MEVLFENAYTRDRKMVKEVYSNIIFFKSKMVICDAIILLLIIYSVGLFFLFREYNSFTQFMIIFYIIVRLFGYSNAVQTSLKRDAELSKGAPADVTIKITEDTILAHTSYGSTNELAITSVRFATKTNNYIVFQTEAKHLVIFKKDGFSVGTYKDFLLFLQRKNIKIK